MCWFFWDATIFCNKFMLPNQTKILENGTARRACLFEWLCDGSSPKSSTHTFAKYLEMTRPTQCSVFQNLRLGSIKFARWSKDSNIRCDVLVYWDATIFCDNFARWLQKIVATCDVFVFRFLGCSFVTSLQLSTSKMRSQIFGRPSKIVVWGA